jgi:hypothetical protein
MSGSSVWISEIPLASKYSLEGITMAKFRKTLTSIIALAMLAFSSGLIAQAAQAPSLMIASSGTSLTGTTISDFDPEATLRLELRTNSGEITIELGSSGALVAPGSTLKGATVAVVGKQAQINNAIATATISQNCSASRTITGKVNIGPDVLAFNPANGHWYANVSTAGISWDQAKLDAAAKTLPNSTGRGYLATITSAAENTFINDNFSNIPFIGASDAQTEGDWFWMDGPEAGTMFFSNGAPVGASFVKWGTNEPNNLNNEDYAQLWTGDTWNDHPTATDYLVEFGGMPGDNFTGAANLIATATKTITVPVLMSGAGTKTSPYLVTNALDFASVKECSGAGIYFQQTQDIAFTQSFTGLGSFSGHYDGNGNDLDVSAVAQTLNGRNPVFGNISGTTAASDTSVSNLNVIGGQADEFDFGGSNSIFADSINYATIDNIHLSGSKMIARYRVGLLASSISNSVVKNSSVTGEIDIMMLVFEAGGLAATANDSQFSNVQCNITFGQSEIMPLMDELMSVGGCVGRSNNSSYTNVSSTGSLNFNSEDLRPMFAFGIGGLIGESYMDQVADSSSSVSLGLSEVSGLGGLIGTTNLSTISRSFATGSISNLQGSNTGGLIGFANASTINNVYATGAVSANSGSGSLIGEMLGTTLANAYATGLVTVSTPNSSRGLVGISSSPDIIDSYWKILANGVPSTIESLGQEVPKHAGELKKLSTFANWNISATPHSDNDWAICPEANGGYPYLAWQQPANACSRSFKPGAAATVVGLAYVGSSITATPANWDPLATLSYQWLDGTTPITGATAAVLPLNAALKGKSVSVRVTGAKAGYISSQMISTPVVVAGPPTASTGIIGGFASKSSKLGSASKAAVTKTLKGLGVVLQIKCEGFITAKKLSAAQKKLATSRAVSVCSALKAKHKGATVRTSSTLAKKSYKIKEGVRVTITQVKR